MTSRLFIYNTKQNQFVECGYGILKINESHDPLDLNKLHTRLSKISVKLSINNKFSILES
jgi:hypothetical protein